MRTKNQVLLPRKTLYGIMLLGLFFSVFGAGNLPSARAQDGEPITPTPKVGTQPLNSGGVGFQMPKPKQSLERLTKLITTTNKVAALEDKSNLKKMDSHLLDLVFADLSGMDVRQANQNSNMKISDNRAVLLDIYINGSLDEAVTQLKGLGMQVMATNDAFGGVVEGYLPVASLIPAANLSFTKAFLPVRAYGTNIGSVTSEGDVSHNGSAARALGTNGAGVVVGVISDSINQVGTKVAGSQASFDLPANVAVLSDDVSGTDEGRAMAEIIYDTAPGITSMYFASGTNSGAAGKAASINNLVSHGVDIIADDIIWLSEPFFQDGMVAQAVDSAYNSGVAYFASAGNYERQSYESNYRDLGNSDHSHDFDPGAGADAFQTVTTVANGAKVDLILQWDDPWGAAKHDFDIFLLRTGSSTPLDTGQSDNIQSGIPFEEVSWTNNTGSPVTVVVAIDLYASTTTNPAFLKYISLESSISEYNTSSDTIGPDAASAKGAMTVAAVPWYDSGLNDAESFSSRGPTTRLFNAAGVRLTSPEVRQKPDIAGADCVSTSVVGFSFFCGTSAAAPSVAGVAALVLADRPAMTPGVLYMVLKNPASTIDCSASGYPDNDCGYGFVLADKAVTLERNLSYLFLPLIRR